MLAWINETKSNRHLKSNPQLFESRYPEVYKEVLDNTPDGLPWIERLYWYIYKITDYPVCQTCGKRVNFINFTKGYCKFCSAGCTSKNPDIKKRKQQTCLEHYGVDNPSKSETIQDRKIKTSLERYGVPNPTQNNEILNKIYTTKLEKYGDKNYNNPEKVKQTNLERYGVEYYTQVDGFHEQSANIKEERYGDRHYNNPEKNKQTNLKRYGVENPINLPEVREKSKQTNLEKYGTEYASQSSIIKEKTRKTDLEKYGTEYHVTSEEVREKSKQTYLKRYGVENPFNSEDIRKKIKQTNLEKYGFECATKNPEVKRKLSESLKRTWVLVPEDRRNKHCLKQSEIRRSADVLNAEIDNGTIIYTCICPHPDCAECTEKIYKIPSSIYSTRRYQHIEVCTKLYPIQYNRISNTSIETFIKNILDEYNISYETNNRTILAGKELDIYIPDRKIAIECNGIYWHSLKDPKYHFIKWKECYDQGIQLLTLWEDQIKTKPDIIRNILLSKLHIYEYKIGARQCILKEVSSTDSKQFLNLYHLQGPVNGSVRYGLYYNDELVSLMVFGHKRAALGNKEHNDYELYRYCSKGGWSITGGAQKLLKYFTKNHPGENVESFSSNDISIGDLYSKLGFERISDQPGSYWYIDSKMNRYHRYTFRKDVLVKNGADPNKTEFEITNDMGLYRIYDSGQQCWRLNLKIY